MQSKEPIATSDVISKWWGPDIRDPERSCGLGRRFQDDPARLVIVDDALEAGAYGLLSQALRTDCDWAPMHGLVRRSKEGGAQVPETVWVDKAGFLGADPRERRFQHEAFVRARPGRELSPGMLALVRFKAMIRSTDFLDVLERFTGRRPSGLQELLIRRMVKGDLAKPHDDAIGGRLFCLLLYFSDGWRPEFGGEFVVHEPGGERVIEPLPNRAVLFDVNAGLHHSVRPLAEATGDWCRYNFSIWFN